MVGENVDNFFEQPGSGSDNVAKMGGTFKVDVISELTSGTGVTIDGVLLKDGAVETTGPAKIDANTGISANAGGGQGSATALTGQYNNVTTVATAGDSVKLLPDVAGLKQTVKNSGANTLAIFPNTDDSVNALAVNLSIDLLPGAEATFIGVDATIWETKEAITLNAPTTQTGSLSLKATDNAANHDIQITNASHGQDSTYSIPDSGLAAASFAVSTADLTTIEVDKLDISAQAETIDSGAVASVLIKNTKIDNTTSGAGAITLAAPDATMYGVVKTIEMTVDNGDVTLSLANVQGGSSATTATFNAVNDTLIMVGGTNKWHVIGESGVVLT